MSTPTLYVSGYLEQHERRHVALMLDSSQTGNFVPSIEFFLEAMRSAADESSRRADHLIHLRERYREQLHEARSSALTLKLVDALFELPLMTTQRAMRVLDVTAATAGQHLNSVDSSTRAF